MEYNILKLYQNKIQDSPEMENRINLLEHKVKIVVIVCFIAMIGGLIEALVTLILFSNQLWYLIGFLFCIVAMFVLFMIDNKDQRNHMDKYIDLNKKKIDILEEVLSDIALNNREKIEELISIYQEYIDKKNVEEKNRNQIIVIILSAFAGILTISFENMGLIGMNFTNWLYLATLLLFIVAVACIWIYTYKYYDMTKRKYEMMIKDIKELLLIKY